MCSFIFRHLIWTASALVLMSCSTPDVQVRSSASPSAAAPSVRWGPSGNPEGPHLLISDQATQTVALVDLGGHVVQRYKIDGTPGGVTHDRAQGQGFWVCITSPSSERPILQHISWYGDVMDSIDPSGNGNNFHGCRGLDMHTDQDPDLGAILALVSNNINRIDVTVGISLKTRQRAYETSYHEGSFLAGFWGNAVASGNYQDAPRWTTVEGRIERWLWTARSFQQTVSISTPRGIALSLDGQLFVVDQETRSIHVFTEDDGTLIRSFPSPDGTPAGISYDE